MTEDKIPELSEKKVLLDLSVPTNVHPKVRESKMIEYISYEELSKKARENLLNRSGEVEKIRKMAREEVENFQEEDPYEDIYKEVEVIRREQVEKAKKELEKREETKVLQDFSRSLTKKILSVVKKEINKNERSSGASE
ncbi:hypothetical protein AKJ48_02530 [candidate division MSBL1 archaeon SCGC-AAA261O19]|uniref:Tetrapyrrole biosynthesis glutamyl-tRNA reductase dimerisation domain-containing protein n=1 Tax=candidate division MSBL1 archaeon SCGC-AAA261O19 TaxID=1698277 RepID=A0A133VDG9_9EURY|nr:hypothetical protein AKJ48_02530 [candidate division MSBL1 archaeon SCGC-AAA261O19]